MTAVQVDFPMNSGRISRTLCAGFKKEQQRKSTERCEFIKIEKKRDSLREFTNSKT